MVRLIKDQGFVLAFLRFSGWSQPESYDGAARYNHHRQQKSITKGQDSSLQLDLAGNDFQDCRLCSELIKSPRLKVTGHLFNE